MSDENENYTDEVEDESLIDDLITQNNDEHQDENDDFEVLMIMTRG